MTDAPKRVWIGLRGVNTHKADLSDTEYVRADLIDMDLLRKVAEALDGATKNHRWEITPDGAST